MAKECSNILHIRLTQRFGVLEATHNNGQNVDDTAKIQPSFDGTSLSPVDQEFPVVALYDLLVAHGSIRRRQSLQKNTTKLDPGSVVAGISSTIQQQLFDGLVRYGFVLITVPKGRAADLIRDMRTSLFVDFFPMVPTYGTNIGCTKNLSHLLTSPTIYISERGIPMYKLGYEACEDGVREVFRVAAGEPDTVVWPSNRYNFKTSDFHNDGQDSECTKAIWTRGLGFLRHVTDAALDLLLRLHCHEGTASSVPQRRQNRPNSGAAIWWQKILRNDDRPQVRSGDFSVLYAMHYFNDGESVEPGVVVKAHVDPSLLVVEPFLCTTTSGLQVWDRKSQAKCGSGSWIDCDGPSSPMYQFVLDAMRNDEEVMLLFAGKALSATIPSIAPTLHRVVTGTQSRRTIIYEQKYAEFYPPPSFD